ncbi:MAG: cobalamin-binding protein [Alphaproteobacteria bacterium]|jgi:5-methyltetrahydrofolate--homocysteine methyltransferase|nr:cobalamin-binding protein [Magnetovibrio sp.]MBN54809.1 cobalamin-binding protein [Alphaproteobacteria bacterium]MDP6765320.1 corrinoid protein [SAR324 cluster bacterium]
MNSTEQKEELLDQLYDQTVEGQAEPVKMLTDELLKLGMAPNEILDEGLIPALEEVGRMFEEGTYFVPEMLVAAKAMQGAMGQLAPLIAEQGIQPIGTFVMGTVHGDIHDIGKDLCNIMLEGAGYKVIDLGVNVSSERFVEAIKEHQPDALGMSAFLTTTMPMLKTNIEVINRSGVRDRTKLYVGGAPVTLEYSKSIGADGYAPTGSALVRDLKKTLSSK